MRKPQKTSAASAKKKPIKTSVKAAKKVTKAKVSPVLGKGLKSPSGAKKGGDVKASEFNIGKVLRQIWQDAPKESKFEEINKFFRIPQGEGTSMRQIRMPFESAVANLEGFVLRGNFKQAAKLIPALLEDFLFAKISFWEEIIPEFAELQVMSGIVSRITKEAERKRKTKDRTAVAGKSIYRKSCEDAMLDVVLLHRAGWKKHWIKEAPLPVHKWGSNEGRKDWGVWMRSYLVVLHNKGDLKANSQTKFAKEGKANSRSKDRDKFFKDVYGLGLKDEFDFLLDKREVTLDFKIDQELEEHFSRIKMPLGFSTSNLKSSYLGFLARRFPECAPVGFNHQRIKLPETIC
ncbi:MAG: hypothetical protein NT096_00035 [Proteobacteria bacterium]|nr:hypothetical protein [Pseudomonadota bacterium]